MRNVVVEYGLEEGGERKGRDWVFLLGELEGLRSVVFRLCGTRCEWLDEEVLRLWWASVVDAVREGRRGRGRGIDGGLRLSCVTDSKKAMEAVC